MGTPLSPEERDSYAPPGGLLRKLLDDEMAPWPSAEEIAHEDAVVDLLSGKAVTLPIGQKGGGRLAAMELWISEGFAMNWRIVHLDPPPPEDTMGAPDFPLAPEKIQEVDLNTDPWLHPDNQPRPPQPPTAPPGGMQG